MLHRSVPLLVTGVLLLAACGASEDTVDSTPTTPPTTIDLTIGLFTPNEAGTTSVEPADGTVDPNGSTTTVSNTVVEDTILDADPLAVDDGVGDPSTSGSLQGLITIGDVAYPFDAATCQVSPELVDVSGTGVASDGTEFEAAIFFSSDDVDADGIPETTLEIEVTGVAGADGSNFYGFTSGNTGVVSDRDITAVVEAPRISGAGPVTDLNGIAFGGAPTPMTFEATCS